nr:patatin-like phospholipase family protein [Rhodoferax koreense]
MARQYKKLLRDDLDNGLSQLAACVLPEWRLATSDYTSGKRAMLVFNDRGQMRSADAIYLPTEDIGIAKALSASTGIPGAFEPLRWKKHQLADGGILDNQGLRELMDTSAERLCIDASAPLAPLIWQSGWTAPLRAMDMLMEQTRGDVLTSRLPIVSLRDDIPSPSAFRWRGAIAALRTDLDRTDLDRFTSLECDLAFLAGLSVYSWSI